MATDSMILGGLFELLGGTVPAQSAIPGLVGATFRLLNPSGGGSATGASMTWDLGAPQPTTDIVQSLLLDGERPFGYRASNRTITLPIRIMAPDDATLAAAEELLMQTVDQQTWTLAWTPASTGLKQVFDCFRALPTVFSYGFQGSAAAASNHIAVITLTFPALPYGRSDDITGLQTVNFVNPLVGGLTAPASPVVLDTFSSVSGTNWSQSSTQYVTAAAHSAMYTQPSANPNAAAAYSKTGLSVSLTGLPSLSVWFGQAFDVIHLYPWIPFKSNVTLAWTLTDSGSNELAFRVTRNNVPWSVAYTPTEAAVPKWTRITAPIPQGNSSFNYNAVVAYSVVVSNDLALPAVGGGALFDRVNCWLDSVTAQPPSVAYPNSERGYVYNILGIPGTARTPFSSQFQLPSEAPVVQTLTGTGLWWPPLGVTSVKAECIGAGGSGASRTTSGYGGGGGGGEYACEPVITVAAGTPVPYSCGAAGIAAAAQVVRTFIAVGQGSWTCPANVTSVKAECWGGGSAGAPGGGGGGGGEYACEPALAVTPGTVYQFTVGRGGTTAIGQGGGGFTAFPGNTVTVTANGGLVEKPGGYYGGAGGSGSINSVHYAGGAGGTSPSYGGGGGGESGAASGAGTAGSPGSGTTGGAGGPSSGGSGAGGNGASSPGFPQTGSSPGGGGGGGATSGNIPDAFGNPLAGGNQPGSNGAPGMIQLTYAPSLASGGITTFGSSGSQPGWNGASGTSGLVVTAHGGQSAALNSATGGIGGTGSSSTTHYNGGAGFTATASGGGGGGSGGSSGAGAAAASSNGAYAIEGGGKGGNGTSVVNNSGQSAAPPGGGGGGSWSNSSSDPETGGLGGGGQITLTHTPPLAPFSTLVAHRPGQDAPQAFNPCVQLAVSGTNIEVPVQPPVTAAPGQNATFYGTYSVVLVAYNWDSPTVTRTVTVAVNQYEYQGSGKTASQKSVSRTFVPSAEIVNGVVMMGEVTLPVKDLDPSNTSGYFTITVTDTDPGDQFLDVLFLDTQGETVIVNLPAGSTYTNFYVDEPTTDRDLGRILGSDLDRSQAVSVLGSAIVSGVPFYLDPAGAREIKAENAFFVYSPSGTPSLQVSFLPRWYLQRLA